MHLLGHSCFLEFAHLPTIIAGDYNDWRNTLGKHHFTPHGFRQATDPVRRFRSFPSFLALAALDKVYYRGDIDVRHAGIVRTPRARLASDHLPLVLDFHLANPAQFADDAAATPAECARAGPASRRSGDCAMLDAELGRPPDEGIEEANSSPPSAESGPVCVTVAGNHLTLFVQTWPLIESMLRDLRAARTRIWLETYIFHDDAAGRAVAEVLRKRAVAGVQVRVLYDAIGSKDTSAAFFRALEQAGAQVHAFHSVREALWKFSFLAHPQSPQSPQGARPRRYGRLLWRHERGRHHARRPRRGGSFAGLGWSGATYTCG